MEINSLNIGSETINPTQNTTQQKNEIPEQDFQEFLNEAIEEVNNLQQDSQALNQEMAAGKIDNLHDVVIASEKADLALNLTVQIRNELVEAYEELMRMQI